MSTDIDQFARRRKSTLIGFCREVLINHSRQRRSHKEE